VETTDHFDGTRFFNPNGARGQPFSALPRLLRTPRTPWPSHIDVQPGRPPALETAPAIVTFIGHSTFLIQTPFGNILTDPMYSRRAGPFNRFGPRRVRQPAVPLDQLPHISVVLLSHNHYDHCDVRTLGLLADRFDPIVITPLRNAALVRSAGIRRVQELDWWEEVMTASIQVSLTPAQHFSARGPFDRNRALWGGFTLVAGGLRMFFAGDSGAGTFFREIRERLGRIDLALLPIGAYEPRWFMKDIHMNPREAVQAHLDLEAAQSIGMHFGTFQLTTEGIDEPRRALEEACRALAVPQGRFRTLDFGESFLLE
jgi:L-ascorbate metabolism protein UlaG (beta-lactamase superfamily)